MILKNRLTLIAAAWPIFAVIASGASAQDASGMLQAISTSLQGSSDGTTEFSGRLIQIFALMTVLSVAPGMLVVMTSFTRFIIVFSMLRSALGLNQTPPNMVLSSLALFMTFFVMQPVLEEAWDGGLKPLLEDSISEEQAISAISEPFKEFMFVNTREKDLLLFQDISGVSNAGPSTLETTGWRELIPAFVISELRRAFVIGFLIYMPFIVIDLIVASVLMSAGMMMLPPVMISLPFKVIFFVLIDGWYMIAGSLIESYIPIVAGG
jgi:flagellar biosynthesis protein FliP